MGITCNKQSVISHSLLKAGALVPWWIAIIMANLPGARQERFTAEETDVLVRAVKDQEVALYGDGRNPSKLALVKRVWKEIATVVSTASHIAPGLGSSAHGLSSAQGPAEEGAA